jgi:hypothetical protein
MSFKKTISFLFSLTFFSLIFVFFQTQIITLGYCVQSKRNLYQQLVDENDTLRYGIKRLESLEVLGKRISFEKAAYEMPVSKQLVKISVPKEYVLAKNNNVAKKNVLSLIGLQKEAEARPLR